MFRGFHATKEQWNRHILSRGKSGEQVVGLKDHADPVGSNGIPTSATGIRHRFTGKLDLARVGIEEAGGQKEQRAFSAARRPGKQNLFTFQEGELWNLDREALGTNKTKTTNL